MNEISFEITHLEYPIASTYDYLVSLLQKSLDIPSGRVILTDYQTAGRGQRNNNWFSSPGLNALPSIYLRLNRPIDHIWSISEATAIAIYKSYKSLLPKEIDIAIKWPNDIFVQRHKIAGILIHNVIQRGEVAHTIIGVGMNINENAFPEYLPEATSLHLIMRQRYDITSVLNNMLKHLGEELIRQDLDVLHQEYINLLYQWGDLALYQDVATQERFVATIVDVDTQGNLQLVTSKGERRSYAFKEIVYL